MSKLSFKTFCIEMYAEYRQIPGNEVYSLFEKEGVLDMLDRDYELLGGHTADYLVRDIDRFLGGDGI